MARRLISSMIATDRRVAALSCPTARLLFTWMIPNADSKGRMRGEPAFLHQAAIPYEPGVTDADVAGWLTEMVEHKLILWYSEDGERYIQLLGWRTKGSICVQRFDRGYHSYFPDPPLPLTTADNHRLLEGEGEVEGEVEEEVEGEGEEEGKWGGEGETQAKFERDLRGYKRQQAALPKRSRRTDRGRP